MTTALGVLFTVLWLLYVGQLISVLNFGLAQRLGLQEKPEDTDPLFGRLELWTARWDLLWLWTLPAAGILMLIDDSWWPYAAMVGGSAYVDTGGREIAKILSVRRHGLRTGSPGEVRLLFGTHALFVTLGGLAIVAGLIEAT